MSLTIYQRKILLHLAFGNSLTRDPRKHKWFDSANSKWFREADCQWLWDAGYLETCGASDHFEAFTLSELGRAAVAYQVPTIERMAA